MNEERKAQTARISGAGRLPGGEYDSIHISGSGKIDGNVACLEGFHASGSAAVLGSLSARDIHVPGSIHIQGDVRAESIAISGSGKIDGEASVSGVLRVSGSAVVRGPAHVHTLRASGSVRFEEGAECELFEVHGSFRVGGLLNAQKIEIEIGGVCEAGDIGGESVRAYRRGAAAGSFLGRLLDKAHGAHFLTAETIEADAVDLEATRAKTVRGRDVRIGDDCEIDRVEHSGTIEIAEGAVVREIVKVEA